MNLHILCVFEGHFSLEAARLVSHEAVDEKFNDIRYILISYTSSHYPTHKWVIRDQLTNIAMYGIKFNYSRTSMARTSKFVLDMGSPSH